MDPSNVELRLSELRRELQEILSMIEETPIASAHATHQQREAPLSNIGDTEHETSQYDIAIDQNKFLSKETQQLAFSPMISTKGETLPYGLGWFTQNYEGTRLIWHYGFWTCNSSLILKVPERNITFIAMANTDNLSRPTRPGSRRCYQLAGRTRVLEDVHLSRDVGRRSAGDQLAGFRGGTERNAQAERR